MGWLRVFSVIVVLGFLVLFSIFLSSFKERGEERLGVELYEVLDELEAEGIKPVSRGEVFLKGKAVWAYGSTVRDYGVNLVVDELNRLGVKHVFLLVKGTSGTIVKEVLSELTPKAHEKGISVHAWIVCFSDASWTSGKPSPESYEYRKYLLRVISGFLTMNMSGSFVDGIHLDYVRYSGNAQDKYSHVSSFVREARILIDRVAPGTVLSIASKAENYASKTALFNSALFYGQNYTDLANYVDLFCPMTYYLDYSVTPDDFGIAGKWFRELTGKPVFAGIQLHPSEASSTRGRSPTPNEIQRSLESCLRNEIEGAIFFRLEFILQSPEIQEVVSRYYSD
ncbi:MAG: hypothetical protein QXZ66_09900 [Thermoproteota archaeon]